jgi:hypothetical protein
MQRLFTLPLLLLFTVFSFAQTQTIRGKVREKESKMGIPGASVVLLTKDSTLKIYSVTDGDGNFRLENVPLGRHAIRITFIGYQEVFLQNIIVDAGKETILNPEMEESVNTLEQVDITGTPDNESSNEMSLISVKPFNIEETNRYAGSRSDPARMASNFAGVTGSDDSRNDIIIRGNSPMGVLWRVEGIDVPNPNHFAIAGSTGGAISILNNKVFGTSDFFMGAFPAEFGNANSGVFDIHFRNGNNEKHELNFQLGLLGTEFSAEGPMSKAKGSTYLMAYRYSTLKLFEGLKIPLGTSAVPNYQDLSFKLNFPGKNNSNFSVFGMSGTSTIDIVLSTRDTSEVEIYGDNNRDQFFTTGMGMVGMTWSKSIDSKNYIRATLGSYYSYAGAEHDIFTRDSTGKVDTLFQKLDYRYHSLRQSLNVSWNHKFNAKHSLRTGLLADYRGYDYVDSNNTETPAGWVVRNNFMGNAMMMQPYSQWKWRKTDQLSFTFGLHGIFWSVSGDAAVEPRAAMKYSFKKRNAIALGYGLHSQVLPEYVLFAQSMNANGNYELPNKKLGLMKSHHLVAGYDRFVGAASRIKVETYYQYIYQVPVDTFKSSFSLINQGSTFSRFFPGKLTSRGTAYNYGVELTFERGFRDNWYMLMSGSLYNSRYKGSDGVERNSDYNGGFVANGLAGKEFKMGKSGKTVFTTATKVTWAGGRRYSPADTLASAAVGELVEVDTLRNSLQFQDYFRWDIKLGIKINTARLTHEIAIDLVNVLNTQNVLGLTYVPNNANPIRQEYQLGFLPLFYYKVDFGLKAKAKG